jgi:hypothetical protein
MMWPPKKGASSTTTCDKEGMHHGVRRQVLWLPTTLRHSVHSTRTHLAILDRLAVLDHKLHDLPRLLRFDGNEGAQLLDVAHVLALLDTVALLRMRSSL